MADFSSPFATDYFTEEEYLANDPWYGTGAGISKIKMPEFQSDKEAILYPLLTGLLGGALRGYGKQNAMEKAWKDYSTDPLLAGTYTPVPELELTPEQTQAFSMHDYRSNAVPEGWTPKLGRADLLRKALERKASSDMQEKLALKLAELQLENSPDITALKVAQKQKIENVRPTVDPAIQKLLTETLGVDNPDYPLAASDIQLGLQSNAQKRLEAQKKRLAAAEERNQQQFESNQADLQVHGYIPIGGVAGEDDAKEAKNILDKAVEYQAAVDYLMDTLKDGVDLSDEKVARQKAAATAVNIAAKNYAALGGAIPEAEASLGLGAIPQFINNPYASWRSIFRDSALGADPLTQLNAIKESINRTTDARMLNRKFERDPSVSLLPSSTAPVETTLGPSLQVGSSRPNPSDYPDPISFKQAMNQWRAKGGR